MRFDVENCLLRNADVTGAVVHLCLRYRSWVKGPVKACANGVDMVGLCVNFKLFPQFGQFLRMLCRHIIGLAEVCVQIVERPLVVFWPPFHPAKGVTQPLPVQNKGNLSRQTHQRSLIRVPRFAWTEYGC